jgi:malate synthase
MLKVVKSAPSLDKDGKKLLKKALPFVEKLAIKFDAAVKGMVSKRLTRVDRLIIDTWFSNTDWKIAKIPDDLKKRTVEITGPPSRKMVINALNSGADCYMADFEDSCSPTWTNLMEGQVNLRDAVNGTISLHDKKRNKKYKLKEGKRAVLMVRPRGLHLLEKHLELNGKPISACLFDFGTFVFTNFQALLNDGTAPYFYLPKLEHAEEAKLWDEIISYTEEVLGLYHGTIKCTVLIETLPAAFQMDEILWELRNHIVGLNCGRWDYIFSCIKNQPGVIYPDRDQVGMNQHAMKSYVDLLIKTCHKRGAFAMGGMAAQIPIKGDPEANEKAIEKVRKDKEREVRSGHDGTWIAHPGLLETARNAFDSFCCLLRKDVHVNEGDLLRPPIGSISLECVEQNVEVCMKYIEAWLAGNGCVPLNNLMEDAATAEISRTQLWQWVHNNCSTAEGTPITIELVQSIIDSVKMKDPRPGLLLGKMIARNFLERFLTIQAYDELIQA